MRTLKFGGTSVGSSEMIKITASIIIKTKEKENITVVVSAVTKITNRLIEICDLLIAGKFDEAITIYYEIKEKHLNIYNEILNNKENHYYNKLINELKNLEDIIKGIGILKNLNEQIKAKILYYGEVLSSILVAFAINEQGIKSNNYLSKNLLICEGSYLNSECNFKESKETLNEWIKNINLDEEIPVITGFGGGDKEGNSYLFDRGGSDYVASLIGRFLKADAIEIWTDVDGIMSADPRIVENPILWKELDYGVCAEFALVGAKVLHPKTISPAQEKFIPVYIKNTFNPEFPGTKICRKVDKGIKGVNIDTNQVLLNFIDPTMIGGYGYVFQAVKILNDEKISLDALATTETSFSISIKSKFFDERLRKKFLNINDNFKVEIYENITKVSIVGDTIDDFDVLSKIKESIFMITSGAYGKSLTFFVNNNDSNELLKEIHKNIFGK
ncbi:MAG: aspartate kinase [Candidatus Gracilibacteria bacterium]|nr:aspartate kinase [Candidatus Gracilibacteria bacterium]